MTHTFHERIHEVEKLADALEHLLAENRPALSRNGVYHEAQGLARWAERYRQGLQSGLVHQESKDIHKTAWIAGVSDRLKLEAQELNSLDGREETASAENLDNHPDMENFINCVRHIVRTTGHKKI